jgi:hypothetical protein
MTAMNHVCPVCEATIAADAPVSLLHGEVLHKDCFEETMGARPKPRARPVRRVRDGKNGQHPAS